MKRGFLLGYQCLLVASALALFLFLFDRSFAPSGTLVLEKSVDRPSPFLSRILPDTRTEPVYLDADGTYLQNIVGDPAYFTLLPPRSFDTIEVEAVYKNATLPVVELGALVNPETDQYALQPLQNRMLDTLDWPVRREGSVVLYDRDGAYPTVAAFLADPPPQSEIATYHYSLDTPFHLDGYRPSSKVQTLDVSLRGEHEFQTYLANERLHFVFTYMDMNRTLGADPVEVLVFDRADRLVAGKKMEDDGNIGDGGLGSDPRSFTLDAKLADGVYKVILKADRDIFFRRIETTQQKITFLNQVFIGDDVGYLSAPRATTFWTDAKSLTLETQHAEGVQDVVVGKSLVPVREPFVASRHRVKEAGVVRATIPLGDMLVRGASRFAFAEGQFFNPDPVRLMENTDLAAQGIRAVIATYTPPEITDGFVQVRATFAAAGLARANGAWKFAFSLPSVYDTRGSIELARLRVTLRRPSLSLGELWRRLREAL